MAQGGRPSFGDGRGPDPPGPQGPGVGFSTEALIEYIAKALVDRPEEVQLTASDAEGGRLFELKVAQDDVGKVIGRDGRTVNAIRTLLAAAAQRKGTRARLEILDDRRGGQRPAPATQPAPEPSV